MKNNQPIVWMSGSGKPEENGVKRSSPISVVRKELIIGAKTVWAFMDATGKYYLNFNQIEELLELYKNAFLSFLAQAGRLSSGISPRENAGFKNQKELRAAWGKGLVSAHGVHNVEDENGRKYRAAEIDLVTQFIRHWDKKENSHASFLTDALMAESLQIRCEAAFVGVSPNVADIHEETNRYMERWENSRTGTIQAHPIFANFCKSNGSELPTVKRVRYDGGFWFRGGSPHSCLSTSTWSYIPSTSSRASS